MNPQQTLAGYSIYFECIEKLYFNSSSSNLETAQRQGLERKLKTLDNGQRKRIHAAMITQAFVSHFQGEFDMEEHWHMLAAYFQKNYPVREFLLIQQQI